MYCKNCGQEIADKAEFCPYCGQPTGSRAAGQRVSGGAAAQGYNGGAAAGQRVPAGDNRAAGQRAGASGGTAARRYSGGAGSRRRSTPALNPKILAGGAAAIIAVIVIILIAVNHRTTVNLNKDLVVTFEGYDTVGTASAQIDEEAFVDKYSGLKLNKKGLQNYLIEVEGWTEYDFEYLSIDALYEQYQSDFEDGAAELLYTEIAHPGSLDADSNLSNGDTVNYTFDMDEEKAEALEDVFGIRLKYSDESYTVEGLEEVETYDPFQNLSVTFEGVGPDGEVSFENMASDDLGSSLSFSAEPGRGLSNGDTVTITVKTSLDDTQTAERYGKIISPREKTYTVEGLSHWVSTASDLPEDVWAGMQSEAQDRITAMTANWSDAAQFKSAAYVGNFILLNKTGNTGWYSHNMICLVYRMDVDHIDGDVTEPMTYYMYYYYSDVAVDSNGDTDLVYTDIRENDGSFTLGSLLFGLRFSGFATYDDLYNNVVTSNANIYTVENNVTGI